MAKQRACVLFILAVSASAHSVTGKSISTCDESEECPVRPEATDNILLQKGGSLVTKDTAVHEAPSEMSKTKQKHGNYASMMYGKKAGVGKQPHEDCENDCLTCPGVAHIDKPSCADCKACHEALFPEFHPECTARCVECDGTAEEDCVECAACHSELFAEEASGGNANGGGTGAVGYPPMTPPEGNGNGGGTGAGGYPDGYANGGTGGYVPPTGA